MASRSSPLTSLQQRAFEFVSEAGSGPVRVSGIGGENFRSFRHVTLRPGSFTAIVGANAAGKSSVIDLFRFISESLRLSLYTALERRGGLRAVRHSAPTRPRNFSVWIELEYTQSFRARYSFRIRSGAKGSYSVAEEECSLSHEGETVARLVLREGKIVQNQSSVVRANEVSKARLESTALALPLYAVFELSPVLRTLRDLRLYSIVPDKLRELQDPDEGRELLADGSNAASVLRHLEPSDRSELVEMLGHVVPGIEDVRVVGHGNKLTLEFKQRAGDGRNTFEALQMSDGTLRLLGLLLALYQRDTPGFLAIEEPEATIHVAALQALVDIFKARADRTQIVITTHSADILDSIDPEAIYLVSAQDGYSSLGQLSPANRQVVQEALFLPGELLRSGALESEGQ
jgi:predicted ATPase